MTKYFKYILLLVCILISDQLVQRTFNFPTVSILIPIIIIISSKITLKDSILSAFILGIVTDISFINEAPIFTIFLIFETLIVWYLSQKHIVFSSITIYLIATLLLTFLSSITFSLMIGSFFIKIIIIEIVINLLIAILLYLIFKKINLESIYE